MGAERAATSGAPGCDGGCDICGAKLCGAVRELATPVFGDSCVGTPAFGLTSAALAASASEAAAAASGESHLMGSPILASSFSGSSGTTSIPMMIHTLFDPTVLMRYSVSVTSECSPTASLQPAHSEVTTALPKSSPSEMSALRTHAERRTVSARAQEYRKRERRRLARVIGFEGRRYLMRLGAPSAPICLRSVICTTGSFGAGDCRNMLEMHPGVSAVIAMAERPRVGARAEDGGRGWRHVATGVKR